MAKTHRQRLTQYQSFDDAVKLLKDAKKVLVLTGAGISTSLGIPDFRSPVNGLYDQIRNDLQYEDYQNEPEDIFHVDTFRYDPERFFACLSKIIPEDPTRYTPAHAFVKALADKQKLLTNYTQNIDGLEHLVGIPSAKIFQCHGTLHKATCQSKTCGKTFPGSQYLPDLHKTGQPPRCRRCMTKSRKRKRAKDSDDEGDKPAYAILKPDIVLFGEGVNSKYKARLESDLKAGPDLLIIMGTSLPTAPLQNLPSEVSAEVPQLWISRQAPSRHCWPDIQLLGEADDICIQLAESLGWQLDLCE